MMDKQKQIEELMKDMCADYPCNRICDQYCGMYDYAERAINAGYRKSPEGAVVLTREEFEKFAERVKMAFYYEFDELIPSIMADKIDEIAREITDKGVQNEN